MSGKRKNKKPQNSKQNSKGSLMVPVFAVLVAIAAIISVVAPKLAKDNEKASVNNQSQITANESANVVIDKSAIDESASFYSSDINGITIELFAVKASDGSIRLALNTCQVCKGSPYAYFEQQGDVFVCQNCKNAFETDSIGLVHGGCNPVPVTEGDCLSEGNKITVSSEFLKQYAPYFVNWKKF